MKKTHFIFFIALFLSGKFLSAQNFSAYQKKWLVQGGDTLPYRVLLPENYDASKKYPLIIFLHGAGERGNDNEKQLVHGADLFLKEEVRKNFPAIVIFPQCSRSSYWSNVLRMHDSISRTFNFLKDGEPTRAMQLAQLLLNYILNNYPVNKKQVYVGGLSMGGMGTFEIVRRNPGIFAAAFAICGGADPATASSLKQTHWWIFHGLKDDIVNPDFSKNITSVLKKAGADVRLTLYPNDNHNSWDDALSEKELLSWLFSKHL
jgi:predicted peptidase